MKQRLDIALVERGLAETRARAQALIMAGEVLVDGGRADKAGMPVPDNAVIEIKEPLPYVSRGGLKLAHAIESFGLAERIMGKVRDPSVNRDVIIRLSGMWQREGLHLAGLVRSPITGPAGNIEYLAYLEKRPLVHPFDLREALAREVLPDGK